MTRHALTPSLRPKGIAVIWFAVLLDALVARGQLPVARLDSLFPAGGRVGSRVEVLISGSDLDDAYQVYFSHEGIRSEPAGTNDATRFTIVIGPNVPVGAYEARVVGRFGISNPRTFVVGELAELIEPADNHSRDKAMVIAGESCVNGRSTAGKSDFFRLVIHAGQRLLVECAAAEIDSRLEPSIWVYDHAGRELGRSRRSGFLEFTAAETGDYDMRVHDFLNRGGEDFFYRLSISSRPQLDYSVPLAIPADTNSEVTIFGRNLPAGETVANRRFEGHPLERITVPMTLSTNSLDLAQPKPGEPLKIASAVVEGFNYRITSSNRVSNPLFISRALGPVATELEPNGNSASAQKIIPPVDLSGEFKEAGDLDWFFFDSKKGDVWQIEVYSQRLGFPTDPSLVLQRIVKDSAGAEKVTDVQEVNDSENSGGGIEDKAGTGDPALRFEAKEDAVYRILLRDQASFWRPNSVGAYRLVVRHPDPDFSIVATPLAPPPTAKDSKEIKVWSPLLRKGGVVPIQVLAFRRDGFEGSIDLSVEGLPSGVVCSGGRLAPEARSAVLLVHADEPSTNWAGIVRIVGKGATGDVARIHSARAASVVWGAANYDVQPVYSRLANNFVLGVSIEESAPLGLELGGNWAIEIATGGKTNLPVRLTRRDEFVGKTKLKLSGHPALGPGKTLEIDPAITNAVLELDLAQTKLPVGDHMLYVEAQAQFQHYRNLRATQAADEAKKKAELSVAQAKASTDKPKEVLAEASKALEKAEAEAKKMAKREFNDTFYSMPILVKVVATKDSGKPGK